MDDGKDPIGIRRDAIEGLRQPLEDVRLERARRYGRSRQERLEFLGG